jgi:hypothetical protein
VPPASCRRPDGLQDWNAKTFARDKFWLEDVGYSPESIIQVRCKAFFQFRLSEMVGLDRRPGWAFRKEEMNTCRIALSIWISRTPVRATREPRNRLFLSTSLAEDAAHKASSDRLLNEAGEAL